MKLLLLLSAALAAAPAEDLLVATFPTQKTFSPTHAFSPDSRLIALASPYAGTVEVLSTLDGARVFTAENVYGSVGVQFSLTGTPPAPVVYQVLRNSPAEKAGLKVKDQLAEGGVPTNAQLRDKLAERVPPQARRLFGRRQTPSFTGDAGAPLLGRP